MLFRSVAIQLTGWLWLDPLISLLIVVVILLSTWGLLRDSIDLSIDAVPQGIEVSEVKAYLLNLTNVSDLHDLHIWALSTTENALTVHIVTTDALIYNHFIQDIQEHLNHHFNIAHVTIQVEKEESSYHCVLDIDECKI